MRKHTQHRTPFVFNKPNRERKKEQTFGPHTKREERKKKIFRLLFFCFSSPVPNLRQFFSPLSSTVWIVECNDDNNKKRKKTTTTGSTVVVVRKSFFLLLFSRGQRRQVVYESRKSSLLGLGRRLAYNSRSKIKRTRCEKCFSFPFPREKKNTKF